ncbi:MAG: HAD family hydrolase [Planctomycetota bacterium]|nr:MAG: HAD family hydrolase [Planctomycetota bacterium]
MAKSLSEYLNLLGERSNLIFPKAPRRKPIKATPAIKPIPEIKVVLWSVYGTLLSIDSGRLLHQHHQELRMQIALQKTIEEFKMWQSMSRKPGQPWVYMLQQYNGLIEDQRIAATARKGDSREVDSAVVWARMIEKLKRNEYQWDEGYYGGLEDVAAKVAYFFHAMLQGTEAFEGCAETLARLQQAGIRQGLLDDAQQFTLAQLVYQLKRQGADGNLAAFFSPDLSALSYQLEIRKPSPSLYQAAATRCSARGFTPEQVLYLTNRLTDDLGMAKKVGFRTGLMVVDEACTELTTADLKNPEFRPDRLLTDMRQVLDIVGA